MVDSLYLPSSMFESSQDEPNFTFECLQPEHNPGHLSFFADFVDYLVSNIKAGSFSPIQSQIPGFKQYWYAKQYSFKRFEVDNDDELDPELFKDFDKSVQNISSWLSTLFAALNESNLPLGFFFGFSEKNTFGSNYLFTKQTQPGSQQDKPLSTLPHPSCPPVNILESTDLDMLESFDNSAIMHSYKDSQSNPVEKSYPSPALTVLSSPQNQGSPTYSTPQPAFSGPHQTFWRSTTPIFNTPHFYFNPPHSHVTPSWLDTQAYTEQVAIANYSDMQAHVVDCCQATELPWFHEFIQGWLRENEDTTQERLLAFIDRHIIYIRRVFRSLKDDSDAIDRGKISCKALLKYDDVEFYAASIKIMFEIDKRIRLGPVKANGDKSLTDRSLDIRVEKVCNYFKKCKNSVVRIMKPAFLTDVVDMPDRMVDRFDTNAEGNTKKAEKRRVSPIRESASLPNRRKRRTSLFSSSRSSTPDPETVFHRDNMPFTSRQSSLRSSRR